MEFALVLPIFLLLVLGGIEYGTIFLVRNQLTEAASDAARSAVTYNSQSTAVTTAESSLTADIIHNGAGLVSTSTGCGTWPTAPITVDVPVVSSNPTAGMTCTITPLAAGQPGCQQAPTTGYECLQVKVSYDYADHPILPLPFLPTPSTITAASTVIVGNGALTS